MLDFNFWKKYFTVYDLLNEVIPYQDLLDTIISELELKKTDLVFEAGSGTGNLALKIENFGAEVVAFDSSETGLDLHMRKNPNARIVHGDLTKPLPFADNYFDKICSNNVIYTLSRGIRSQVFKEFYRILKPGGVIVVANLMPSFKPTMIYFDHVSKNIKRDGIYATFLGIFKLMIPTIKIFYYNSLIRREHDRGVYDFIDEAEQRDLLRNAGFLEIGKGFVTYSGQSILHKAYK